MRANERYVFARVARPALPVQGLSRHFPVRRIYCVGRNYASHAREMGGDPDREAPFFFSKPADAIVPLGGDMPYPASTGELHHEVACAVSSNRWKGPTVAMSRGRIPRSSACARSGATSSWAR